MRDKVLCRGCTRIHGNRTEKVPQSEKRELSAILDFLIQFTQYSVPFFIQGGVKMSMNEFLSLFDHNIRRCGQKTHGELLEAISRRELDTISATESLFYGTVVDFDDPSSYSGGGNNAQNTFTAG